MGYPKWSHILKKKKKKILSEYCELIAYKNNFDFWLSQKFFGASRYIFKVRMCPFRTSYDWQQLFYKINSNKQLTF